MLKANLFYGGALMLHKIRHTLAAALHTVYFICFFALCGRTRFCGFNYYFYA